MAAAIQPASHLSVLEGVAAAARAAGVFGEVRVEPGRVVATAKASAAPAEYRVEIEGGKALVGVFTPDRWLSHSVEADLLHTGDDLEELLQDELDEVGLPKLGLRIDHFRNDEKLFTFRSVTGVRLDDQHASKQLGAILLAYEACFRHLGDMHQDEDEA